MGYLSNAGAILLRRFDRGSKPGCIEARQEHQTQRSDSLQGEQIGLDWWKYDHHLSPGTQRLSAENEDLRKQVRALERQLASLTRRRSAAGALK